MKTKATWVWALDEEGIFADMPDSPWWAGKGKGAKNSKNKRMAELVTLALIIHGTLSSHLSHHIEIPCVWFCLSGETVGSYPSPNPHWAWCPGGPHKHCWTKWCIAVTPRAFVYTACPGCTVPQGQGSLGHTASFPQLLRAQEAYAAHWSTRSHLSTL